MVVIVISIYIQLFLRNVFIYTESKTNQPFLRKEYIYILAQILRALLSNKNGILYL